MNLMIHLKEHDAQHLSDMLTNKKIPHKMEDAGDEFWHFTMENASESMMINILCLQLTRLSTTI